MRKAAHQRRRFVRNKTNLLGSNDLVGGSGLPSLGDLELWRLLLDRRPGHPCAAGEVSGKLGVGREARRILREVVVKLKLEVALLETVVSNGKPR